MLLYTVIKRLPVRLYCKPTSLLLAVWALALKQIIRDNFTIANGIRNRIFIFANATVKASVKN